MSKTPVDEPRIPPASDLDRRDFVKAGLTVTAAMMLPSMAGAASGTPASSAAKKVLIINGHQTWPGISEGRLTRTLIEVIAQQMTAKGHVVQHTHIEQGYVIDTEVQKHLWADIIITQSPVFWFGTPWIYKKYVDEVFTAGLVQQSMLAGDGRTRSDPARQYGSGGKMQGKQYLLSLTMNAPQAAYNDPAQTLFAGKSEEDLFLANTANYKFCGVEILPIFSSTDVMKNPQVETHIARLKEHLRQVFG
ncbi:NAD(P)H-dependent oxidoreductase [Pseudomonas sp. 3A(2025)]